MPAEPNIQLSGLGPASMTQKEKPMTLSFLPFNFTTDRPVTQGEHPNRFGGLGSHGTATGAPPPANTVWIRVLASPCLPYAFLYSTPVLILAF